MIMGKILKDMYAVRTPSLSTRLDSAERFTNELEQFSYDIKHFLETPTPAFASFSTPLFQRQALGLRLSLAHARILLHRPFLQQNSYSLENISDIDRVRVENNIQQCIDAAVTVANIINKLYETEKLFSATWFAHFCGYCAVIVLYDHIIGSPGSESRYLKIAETVQHRLYVLPEKESFASRCSDVLRELHDEVMGHLYSRNSDNLNNQVTSEGIFKPVITGFFGIPMYQPNSVIDRIDQWGFSSMTGY